MQITSTSLASSTASNQNHRGFQKHAIRVLEDSIRAPSKRGALKAPRVYLRETGSDTYTYKSLSINAIRSLVAS